MSEHANSLGIEDYLRRYGMLTYRFQGVSMLPLLRQGRDDVTIRLCAEADIPKLKRGDVILFKDYRDAYILHRIVHVEEHEIITRGDNCAYSDQPIQSSQVLGILTGYTHNGRERTVEDRSYRAYSRYIAMTTPVRLVYKRACIRLIELARAMQTRFNG
ncbi:S24/S26 family peptidase [Bifidobacterium catenulatum subsp. kashiwanohense]|uniref:S24/S26 family peptidase n=1 Tax=Bifidobacterium catenulatum TaxID=1686 RepID=UPI00242B372D|nr:S24/S26 family peptidase [Bifidobacterium catenulatum]